MSRTLLAALSALALGAQCAPPEQNAAAPDQADARPTIPGTRVSLEDALFLPGRDTRLPIDSPPGWRVCRSSDHASGSRLGLVSVILNDEDLLQLGSEEDCRVRIMRDAPPANASDFVVDGPGCRFAFERAGEALRAVRLTPAPFVPAQYEKCFYRLGLLLRGFDGALVMPDEILFVPVGNSPWVSFPNPPAQVPVFQYLLSACAVDPARITRRSEVPRPLPCRPI